MTDAHTTNGVTGHAKPAQSTEKRRRFAYADLVAALSEVGAERDWHLEGAVEDAPIVLVSGPEKTCKSWMMGDLCVAVALGLSWLGAFPARRSGDVLVLDGEYGEREYARRVARIARAAGRDPAEVLRRVRYVYTPGARIYLGDDCEPLKRVAADLQEDPPSAVVLDPLRNHLPPGADENNARDVIAALRVVSALRAKARAPLFLVHHLNKQGEMSGSRAIRTRCDMLIEGSDERPPWFTTTGRTVRKGDRIASPFTVEMQHAHDDDDTKARTRLSARFAGESTASKPQLSKSALRMLEALRANARPMSASAIGKACGISNGQVRGRSHEELRAANLVTYDGRGWSVSTPEFFRSLGAET